MSTKTLIITINGDKFDPIKCSSVSLRFENDTYTIDVTTGQVQAARGDVPTNSGFESPHPSETFTLQGEDLDAFVSLSEFRTEDNKTDKVEGVTAKAVTVESNSYNIIDVASVQNATFDLVEREKEFLNEGYKVFQVSSPRYSYEEDNDYFKLVETAVLYKTEEKESPKE